MAQQPNPRTIGICSLIALYSDQNSLLHDLECVVEGGATIVLSQDVVATYLETIVKNKDTNNDDFVSFMVQVKFTLGTQAAELLLETLRMASESVDSLMDLFESLKGAIHEGLVDANSLHGLYLRQYCLGFDILSFESATLLWQALKERIASSLIASGSGDKNDNSNRSSTVWVWPLSVDQLQSILCEDCMNDGRANKSNNRRRGAPSSFEEMEIYIRSMLKNDPELPAAHFLRYLNCLRHGERVGALDAIHEYFDHSLVHSRNITLSLDSNKTNHNKSATNLYSSRDILQFSAILLAMTHSIFGDSNLALLATEEAVRVAQQSKDAACVAFALGWLYEHHGQGTAERQELLRRCASRASQGQLRQLFAGAQLKLAKHALLQEADGGYSRNSPGASSEEIVPSFQGSNWTIAWNHLLQVTAEPSTDHSGNFDRPTYLSENPKETLENMALQRLVSAGIWDSLGMPAMSEWTSKATLHQKEDICHSDILAAIQNISRCALYGSSPSAVTTTTESNCACSYANAIRTLLQLRTELDLEGSDLEQPILQNMALVFHEWAVNRGDMDDAIALQIMLDSYLHPGLFNKDQYFADVTMQKYLYFSRTKNWQKAKNIGNFLVKFSVSKGLVNNQARILIQMGITELESDRKQCTAALSPLLEALAICEQFQMHGLHAASMSILAQVFDRLGRPKRAIAILEATLPILLQREHIWLQATAYLVLAKSHLKHGATFSTPKTIISRRLSIVRSDTKISFAAEKCFHRALTALSKSMKLFEECQDRIRLKEVYYFQARIHSLLSNTEKRNAFAELFLKVNTKRHSHYCILDSLNDPLALQILLDRSI